MLLTYAPNLQVVYGQLVVVVILLLLTGSGIVLGRSATCGTTTVTDADISSTVRLSDSQRGVIQLLATFSSSSLHRTGIAATLAAIKEAETENLLPFHTINISLVNYDDVSTTAGTTSVANTVMGRIRSNTDASLTYPYTAVVGLDYGVTDRVAASLKMVNDATPLINPKTISSTYLGSSYDNLLHYKPSLSSELLHMLRFAFTQLSCANSDIHVSQSISNMAAYANIAKNAFTTAGFPEPTVISTPNIGETNTTVLQAYVTKVLTTGMSGRNVKCVFFLDYFRRDLHELLSANALGATFFSTTSLIYTSIGASTLPDMTTAEASIYNAAFFTSTDPDSDGTSTIALKYQAALAAFNADHSETEHKHMNQGVVVDASPVGGYYAGDNTSVSSFGFEHYVSTRWLLGLLSTASSNPRAVVRTKMAEQDVCLVASLNLATAFATPQPAPQTADVIAAAYEQEVRISNDIAVGPLLTKDCLLTYGTSVTDCFCNVGGKLQYMAKYNVEELKLDSYAETAVFGDDVEMVTITPARSCSLSTTDIASSVPSTLTFIVDTSGNTHTDLITSSLFTALSDLVNTAGLLTDSTMHFSGVSATGYTEYEKQRAYAEIINSTSPFLLLGSSTELSFLDETSSTTPLSATTSSGNYVAATANIDVSTVSDILSLTNGIDSYALEDDVLVNFTSWNSAHVTLSATFADHVQALASFYAEQSRRTSTSFTSISAIVETDAQATLVTSSFTTFQTNITVSVLADYPTSAYDALRTLLADAVNGGGTKPFVVVGLMNNISLASELLYIINGTAGKAAVAAKSGMRFGLAAPEDALNALFELTTPGAEDDVIAVLKSTGLTTSMISSSSSTVNVNPSTLFSRTSPLSFDTSNMSTPDIVFASHLGEWYVPRTSNVALVTPQIFRRVDAVSVAANLLSSSTTAIADGGVTTLYNAINVAGVTTAYGPFYNSGCETRVVTLNERERTCQCAKGPRKFHVLSFVDFYELRASTRTSKFTYTQSGCGVVYRTTLTENFPLVIELAGADSSLSTSTIVGIAVGVTALFGLLIGGFFLVYCCRRSRAVRHAPKDSSLPFAMAFTDIQSSTALWARVPEAMANSVDQHHSILRKCVDKYEGYEVKTIGDSFMVAFHDADLATQFALGVQSALFNYSKWGPELDETYMELLLDQQNKAQEGADGDLKTVENVWLPVDPVSGELDHDAYDRIWKGLRVRVGVHFGIGEIKRDEVSDRYDYYGTVVNTAARVEGVGHGGQVLLTEDAFLSLSAGFEEANDVKVLDLGPQPLRGLDAPVILYQLTPKPMGARVYPPLRLDVENVIAEADADSDNDGHDSDSDSSLNSNTTSNTLGTAGGFGMRTGKTRPIVRVDPWSAEAIAETLVKKELRRIGQDLSADEISSFSRQSISFKGDNYTTFISTPPPRSGLPHQRKDRTTKRTSVKSNRSQDLNDEVISSTNNNPQRMAAIPLEASLSFNSCENEEETTSSLLLENTVVQQQESNIRNTAAFNHVKNTQQSTSGRRDENGNVFADEEESRGDGEVVENEESRLVVGGDVSQELDAFSATTSPTTTNAGLHHTPNLNSRSAKSGTTHNNNNDTSKQQQNGSPYLQQQSQSVSHSTRSKKRLLSLYFFLQAALSTSTPAYKNDVISHLAKKWHVKNKQLPSQRLHKRLAKRKYQPSQGGSQQSGATNATGISRASRRNAKPMTQQAKDDAYDQMFMLMKLCSKVEKTAAAQEDKALGGAQMRPM